VLNDKRKPIGYLNIPVIKAKYERGEAAEDDEVGECMVVRDSVIFTDWFHSHSQARHAFPTRVAETPIHRHRAAYPPGGARGILLDHGYGLCAG
jgi:hypothetical protein